MSNYIHKLGKPPWRNGVATGVCSKRHVPTYRHIVSVQHVILMSTLPVSWTGLGEAHYSPSLSLAFTKETRGARSLPVMMLKYFFSKQGLELCGCTCSHASASATPQQVCGWQGTQAGWHTGNQQSQGRPEGMAESSPFLRFSRLHTLRCGWKCTCIHAMAWRGGCRELLVSSLNSYSDSRTCPVS